MWVEIENSCFGVDSKNIIFGSIYRSPSSSLPEFFTALDKVFHTLSHENKNVVILGDININLLDNNSCHDEYTNCYQGYGFQSLVNIPTRCPHNYPGTVIDHALTNFFCTPEAYVIRTSITDHYPVLLRFNCPNYRRTNEFSKSIFDKKLFLEEIKNADWTRVTCLNDAQSCYTEFSSIITSSIERCTSTVLCRKNYSCPQNPWITPSLLKRLRKKDNLNRKVKKRPFSTHLKERYKKYCNKLNALLKQTKKDYYKYKILETGNNASKQWRVLKNFLTSTSAKSAPTKIELDEEVLTTPKDIANAFSTYFSHLPSAPTTSYEDSLHHASQSFFLYPTTPSEVCTTIANLKITSPGLDNIHASCIKGIDDFISHTFAYIVNLMFTNAAFYPHELKQSKITPVFKKGNQVIISNYRPISILPFLSKVVEKLIKQRLSNYLQKFRLLTPIQFGFRRGLSTNLALTALTDKLKTEIDKGKYVGSVFIDFTKAFDSINHDILFCKLASLGINGPALQLLRNYLHNRTQTVSISGVLSETKTVNKGVPQGSILGPLLFLIYINDLPNCLTSVTDCILYADDTTIFTAQEKLSSVISQLNHDLANISYWCHNNQLLINPSKTKFVVFSTPTKPRDHLNPVYINNHAIVATDECTFLRN